MTPPKNCLAVPIHKDTDYDFFTAVIDTVDKTLLLILACLHLKMTNKQKFNL